MTDWVYEWLARLAVPALSGIGGIVVGTGAMVAAYNSNKVARQSLELAETVRGDEQKREADTARERYRDQLFRVVEPAATALLAHRANLLTSHRLGTAEEVILRSEVLTRIWLVNVVTSAEDSGLVSAVSDAIRDAVDIGRADVLAHVTGNLALLLPTLLNDAKDIDQVTSQAQGAVARAIAYCDRPGSGSVATS